MPCYKRANPKSFLERAEDIAVRIGIMSDADRVAHLPIEASSESGQVQKLQDPGTDTDNLAIAKKRWLEDVGDRTIEQVVRLEDTHSIDSIVLAIEAALQGRANVTAAARVVLVVEAMEREVNNGGFNQFFFNSSNEYAGELASALRLIGVPGVAAIAERALRAIGAQPDWTAEEFEAASVDPGEATMKELNACDEAYYAIDESIAEKLFGYIKANHEAIPLRADSV